MMIKGCWLFILLLAWHGGIATADEPPASREWTWNAERLEVAEEAQQRISQQLLEFKGTDDETMQFIRQITRPYRVALRRNTPTGYGRWAAFVLSPFADCFQQELFDSLDRETHEPTRNAIAQCLIHEWGNGMISDYSRRRWLEVFRDPSPRVALLAVYAAEKDRDDPDDWFMDHPEVNRLMTDPDPQVQALAELAFSYAVEPDPLVASMAAAALEQERRDGEPHHQFATQWSRYRDNRESLLYYLGVSTDNPRSAVPELLKCLPEGGAGPRRFVNRMSAVLAALAAMGERAIPELVRACNAENFEIRRTAALVLAWSRKREDVALPVLMSSLDTECDGECHLARFVRYDEAAIATYGAAAVPELLKYGKNAETRERAARVLAMMEDTPEVTDALLNGLKAPQAGARITSSLALKFYYGESERVLQTLQECLSDESAEVREAARSAIEMLNSRQPE